MTTVGNLVSEGLSNTKHRMRTFAEGPPTICNHATGRHLSPSLRTVNESQRGVLSIRVGRVYQQQETINQGLHNNNSSTLCVDVIISNIVLGCNMRTAVDVAATVFGS